MDTISFFHIDLKLFRQGQTHPAVFFFMDYCILHINNGDPFLFEARRPGIFYPSCPFQRKKRSPCFVQLFTYFLRAL